VRTAFFYVEVTTDRLKHDFKTIRFKTAVAAGWHCASNISGANHTGDAGKPHRRGKIVLQVPTS
jgi:hypothetical protein